MIAALARMARALKSDGKSMDIDKNRQNSFLARGGGRHPGPLTYTTLDGETIAVEPAPRRTWIAIFLIMCGMLLVSSSVGYFVIFTKLIIIDVHSYLKMGREPYMLSLSVASLGLWLIFNGARRAYRRPIDRVIGSDQRPPVLYLRSFSDDANRSPGAGGLSGLGLWSHGTVETMLCRYLHAIGPVVAVGKPGEYLPHLGATRLYVRHESWQRVVADLIDRAGFVVLRAGHSEGLRWEFQRTLSAKSNAKVVVWLPFRHGFWKSSRDAAYSRFRDWAEPGLRRPFPESISGAVFLFFDAEGNPRLLRDQESLDRFCPEHKLVNLLAWMGQQGFLDVGKPFVSVNRPSIGKAK